MKKEKSFFDKIVHDLATFPEEHPIATSIMTTLGVVSVSSIVGYRGYRELLKEERNMHDLYFDTGFDLGVTSITHDILKNGSATVTVNNNDGTSESHVFIERKDNP